VDFLTANPFEALEAYAERVRLAQNVVLPVCRFPILDMWFAQVDHFGLVWTAPHTTPTTIPSERRRDGGDRAHRLPQIRARRVLLEPDLYDANNQQGCGTMSTGDAARRAREGTWKNNSNGQFVAPYETAASGRRYPRSWRHPMIYVQTGFRSQDYAETHPDQMLFNQPNVPHLNDKASSSIAIKRRRFRASWATITPTRIYRAYARGLEHLHLAGVQGVKFDYPITVHRLAGARRHGRRVRDHRHALSQHLPPRS